LGRCAGWKARTWRGDQTIRNKRTMLPGEMTDYDGVTDFVFPRQRKRILRKLLAVRGVQRGGQRRFSPIWFAPSIWVTSNTWALIGFQISERDRTVVVPRSMPRLKRVVMSGKSRFHCDGRREPAAPVRETSHLPHGSSRRDARYPRDCYGKFTSVDLRGRNCRSRPALTRTSRGSFTDPVFQPRWTAFPKTAQPRSSCRQIALIGCIPLRRR